MKTLPFKASSVASFGVELEFQLIDPSTWNLISSAKDLIRIVQDSPYHTQIKPEITQSMIEINSSIHHSSKELLEELLKLQQFLEEQGDLLNIAICGGGTHPFQEWVVQKIFPAKRYHHISKKFGYLSKRATVFGQHVHIGCATADDSIYLTHILSRYVPQLIAISASSPFYLNTDTDFSSTRSTIFSSLPSSGFIPYLLNWQEFANYFYKMKSWGILETMKDVYWDVRPKPEFGTVEVRVCDTPLTIKKAVLIAAYLQSLSLYLLEEKPFEINEDLYYLYSENRFQAGRYGYEGDFIDPFTNQHTTISDDILNTIKIIERYANRLNNMPYISSLIEDVVNKQNDAKLLRELYKEKKSYEKVVQEQCKIWRRGKISR